MLMKIQAVWNVTLSCCVLPSFAKDRIDSSSDLSRQTSPKLPDPEYWGYTILAKSKIEHTG